MRMDCCSLATASFIKRLGRWRFKEESSNGLAHTLRTFFFVGLGFELSALLLQSGRSVAFALVILEMGSHELFAWN
jgi:hypothetical protein